MGRTIDFLTAVTALGTAAYVALGFDYLALDQFGFSSQAVCKGAIFVAVLIGIYIGLECLNGKLRNSK